MGKAIQVVECRFCGQSKLIEVINLGEQPLSGIFLASRESKITSGPLRIVKCDSCGLAQLGDSYPSNEMYGNNYGYRSGLNNSMIGHLKNIADWLIERLTIDENDTVCDIGSNDGTFLNFFRGTRCKRVGVDPTITKYESFYDVDIKKISDFFSTESYGELGIERASLVTSIAMFYDLDRPLNFAREIFKILEDGGHWFFEQSYAPWMILNGTYDSICHEHLMYYSLKDIKNILDESGFTIIQTYTNSVNGGSVGVLAQKSGKLSSQKLDEYSEWLLEDEKISGYNTIEEWSNFSLKVKRKSESLGILIEKIHKKNKKIYGLGASTKGNIILNYSALNWNQLPFIGEVNSDKFGKFTPGSLIPIVDEREIFRKNPDYLLLLPWHFREDSKIRYKDYLKQGGKIILPLPNVEIVGD